ncbi:GNAT family N-acetyltransferase [Chitinophaga dinghuensis]|nr:GNAT family N-acetyltransferase [Chitinophaga dinghuensis]
MPTRLPYDPADPFLVETWLKGWAIARGTMGPVPDQGGFRIDVGWPDQLVRYVFPQLCAGWQDLQHTIDQPYIFLKVCATPEQIRPLLLPPWEICPPGFMMRKIWGDRQAAVQLPSSYYMETTPGATPKARIFTSSGELAALGSIAMVGEYAIFDRIATEPAHQRKGLGSAVMTALSNMVIQQGATTGLLVATTQGKALYSTLNWELYAPYTTIVIPAADR